MDLLESVRRKGAVELWMRAKQEMVKKISNQGYEILFIDTLRYDPKQLSLDEYRRWWYRSKQKLRDLVTGEVEPHEELMPYLAQDGTPRAYNVIVMWSGVRQVLHPPVKALPKYPE